MSANVTWEMLGLEPTQKAATRDMWEKVEVAGGPLTGFVAGEVKPHAVWALRIVSSKDGN